MQCLGFTTSQQFIKLLWFKTVDSLSVFSVKNSNKIQQTELNSCIKSIKTPSKFGELAVSCRKVMSTFQQQHETLHICFHLLLDRVNELDPLEPELASRLLNLSKLCHPVIKVLATLRRVPHYAYNCQSLVFSAYSDEDIQAVLILKMNRLFDAPPHIPSEESSSEEVPSSSASSQSPSRKDALANVQQCKSLYHNVLTEALPRFLIVTRHPVELFLMVQSTIWHLYRTRLGGGARRSSPCNSHHDVTVQEALYALWKTVAHTGVLPKHEVDKATQFVIRSSSNNVKASISNVSYSTEKEMHLKYDSESCTFSKAVACIVYSVYCVLCNIAIIVYM